MTLALTGLSHHSSPLTLRERMAIGPDALDAALKALRARLEADAPAPQDTGALILSTCNRMELYLHANRPSESLHAAARAFLGEWHGLAEPEFDAFLYDHANADAVRHLFRVSASLDSLVVGETEILGQVQQAYEAAHLAGTADKITGVLFQRALKTGKEARSRTRIGEGKVSVASVAVDLAESILKDFGGKTAMVVGSGTVSEQALKSVISRGVDEVIVLNRTLENAHALAAKYRGEAASLHELQQHLHRADIIISSTGAPEEILGLEDFRAAMEKRGRAPMFVIDIAVPRDIDRKIADIDNVYYYDIDSLQQAADRNLRLRQGEVAACEAIVDEAADRFMAWRRSLFAEPTILSMAQEFHGIRERELAKTLEKLNGIAPEQRQEIEYMTKRIVNGILQRPMTRIKEEVNSDDPNPVLLLVKRIFGLEENGL